MPPGCTVRLLLNGLRCQRINSAHTLTPYSFMIHFLILSSIYTYISKVVFPCFQTAFCMCNELIWQMKGLIIFTIAVIVLMLNSHLVIISAITTLACSGNRFTLLLLHSWHHCPGKEKWKWTECETSISSLLLPTHSGNLIQALAAVLNWNTVKGKVWQNWLN
jgi:hypothetical protein